MNRLRPALPRGSDDRRDVEVALARGSRPDVHRFVRLLDVQRALVYVRIDRNRTQPETACGAQHATGDLATVGNEERPEHGALHAKDAERPLALVGSIACRG